MKSSYSKLFSIILISCVGTLAYSNTFHCAFQYDDPRFIVYNPAIKNIQNLQGIWQFWHCRFVTFLSLALNYHFNGLNVFGYHLFNLAVHLVSAVLVWWLTLLTLSTPAMKENQITRHANLIALFAGLVFVSHPLQTEAVTFIWQRAASMAAMFYLASLCLYVKSRLLQESVFARSEATKQSFLKQKFYYIGSLIAAILAMFTKENAVTLPLMVLFYEFTFLKTKKGLDWQHVLPFLLTIFIIPVTFLFSNSETFQEHHGDLRIPGGIITPMHYLLTEFRAMFTYIRLVFLPINQNVDYDYPVFNNIFELPVLISILFLMAIFYGTKRLFSKYRLVSFFIFWFFLTLILPESSFFTMGEVISEHRLYLPLAGYSIFLVSGVYYMFCRHSEQSEESKGVLRSFASLRMTAVVLTMIITCNSVLTYQRNKVWANNFTLWDDAVRKSPHKARPHCNRGNTYYDQGNLTQAMVEYNKSIAIDPNYAEAYYNRGLIYYRLKEYDKAWTNIHKAKALGLAVGNN